MITIAKFEYPGIRISWVREEVESCFTESYDIVTKHEQRDYEELCFENTQPEEFKTINILDAREKFLEWVTEFTNTVY
jgi:hypothetical protein